MRKITTLLAIMAVFGMSSAKAAVTTDMGRDWNPTTLKTILATSGITFPTASTSYPITIDPSLNVSGDEMTFSIGGDINTAVDATLKTSDDAAKKDVYRNTTDFACPYVVIYFVAGATNIGYFEGKVNSATTTISGLQINGTTNNTTYGTTASILFSDAATFDENKITGYTTFSLPKCRGGLAATTINSIPSGTKSFRIYMQAKLVDNGDGTWKIDNTNGTAIAGVTTSYPPRIAYINATLALPFANVTVNYYDADNTSILIKSVTKADQVIDAVYAATSSDKASFTQDGYYYTFSSMQLDNQTVTANGSTHVDVLVKKFTAYSGNYDWTGATDGTWNELIANFNAGGNPLAYQGGNAVSFPESASNKTITIPNAMDFAAQNITVSGSGYSFSGSGVLSGTGTFYVNPGAGNTTTLDITNNLTGGVNVQSGAVELISSTSAASVTLADNTKIKWNGAGDFGNVTTKYNVVGIGTVNIDAITSSPSLTTSNYFINFAPVGNSTTTINVGLGNATQTGTTTFNWNGVSQANYPAGVQLNVTNNTSDTARIQIPRDAMTDRKLHLGTGVAITRGDGAGGIYSIGELNGDAGSFLEGENSAATNREITYTIGSLNTDCEFAGSLIQFKNDTLKNNVNLNKVGTGKLKLSGISSHKGTITATAGTLELTGALNGNGALTVASGATLTGTGSIAGATTVNGTLGGSLNFNSSATLSSTSNITEGTTINMGAGSKLTVDAGNSTVIPLLVLNSNSTSTATYVNNGSATVTSASVYQHLPTGRNWYVGIPVTNDSNIPYSELTNGGATSVSYWDETNGAWVNNFTGNLSRGIGYIAVSSSGTATNNISFSGTLNDGDVDVAVTRTVGKIKEGFNLISNPYPSYLNAMNAINAKLTNMESTIWYRTKGTVYSFETVNTASGEGTNGVTGYIPPMQAFWVRVKPNADPLLNNSETLTFTNAMRSHANPTGVTTTLLKSPNAVETQKIRLQVSNGINKDEVLIYTNQKASNEFDKYDSRKISNENVAFPEIWTVVNNETLVINGYNQLPINQEIILGFKTGQSNNFKIKASQVSNLESATSLILKDKLLDREYELIEGAEVDFTSDVINTTNRFSLILKTNGTITGNEFNNSLETNWTVFANKSKQITVSGAKQGSVISVYNTFGQTINTFKAKSQTETLSEVYAPGMYLVILNNQVKKLIIK
ncbi:MAG: hypothetical protein PHS59_17010 [Paludibacter sp.]|nr:hypothetical protein [Paludibacter sp.]